MAHRAARRAHEPRPDEDRAAGHGTRPQPADELLALQRAAGNQAVSAMLAREPATAEPLEAKAPEAASASAALPGVGTIPLLSVNLDVGAVTGPGGGAGSHRPVPTEIVVTSRMGRHSTDLSKLAASGKAMTVVVTMAKGKVRLTLEGAIVSTYATSGSGGGAVESWTLNFRSIRYGVEGEDKPADGTPRDSWDLAGRGS